MIKPKIASRSTVSGNIVQNNAGVEIYCECGNLCLVEMNCNAIEVEPEDAIRALVEGGKLELWDAAVKLKAARELCCSCDTSDVNTPEIRSALLELCRVVDEMKETTL